MDWKVCGSSHDLLWQTHCPGICKAETTNFINPLAPNDVYIRRTAQITSRRCILNIYSTNTLTEYFKHAAHSPPPSSRCRLFHNAIFLGSCNIHILNTECAEILKKNSGAKGLMKVGVMVDIRTRYLFLWLQSIFSVKYIIHMT